MESTVRRTMLLAAVAALTLALPSWAGFCECCGSSPLILDLDNNGYIGTVDLFSGVDFDLDGNGLTERVGWTYWETPNAFLWLDLDGNGTVDGGHELFGDSTLLPDNSLPSNGFVALATYDRKEFGGNRDGRISPADRIWRRLRLWVDSSHDGISDPDEISTLADHRIVEISLDYTDVVDIDGAGNNHRLKGTFVRHVKELGRTFRRTQLLEDVFFVRP